MYNYSCHFLKQSGDVLSQLFPKLVTLISHAQKCRVESGEYAPPCTVPLCATVKTVLNHVTECQAGDECSCEYM